MEVGAAAAAVRGKAIRQHAYDTVEVLPLQASERIRALHEAKEGVLVPLLCRSGGDDLLRQDIERLLRDAEAVQLTGPHGGEQSRALHEVVAGDREEAAHGYGANLVA